MYYEINVAKNKTHFFATSERSLTSQRELRDALKLFKEKFPEEEGYILSVSYWHKSGINYGDESIAKFLEGASLEIS